MIQQGRVTLKRFLSGKILQEGNSLKLSNLPLLALNPHLKVKFWRMLMGPEIHGFWWQPRRTTEVKIEITDRIRISERCSYDDYQV